MNTDNFEGGLAPARRTRGRLSSAFAAPALDDVAEADIARGQIDAVFGTLARMQLRLDVLAREQADSFATITALLEQLASRDATR